MTEENGKSEKDQTITHCFVTFKSMKGKKRCESDFFDSEALSKDDPVEMERIFLESFLYIREAKPPGTILWANVAYSYWNRTFRTIFIWILALVFIMLSFVFVLRFKASNDALTVQASLDADCPIRGPHIQVVYDDHLKAPGQKSGFMHCFCLRYLNDNGSIEGSREEFLVVASNF